MKGGLGILGVWSKKDDKEVMEKEDDAEERKGWKSWWAASDTYT